MNVLLSSIAKNDIRLLMRVFNAEEEKRGNQFLENLKESIDGILQHDQAKGSEISVMPMQEFPVNIHYVFEDGETLLITAVFKI
ncbi:hypothetical protein [Chryseobacterium hagamense]|uniref:Plasmid stabilization protein n=1 Tax=Chryseobacterium hagamense TaxID=395935 RepID=A0A511YPH8_9FLAO|nr:hypothetical protein [Chryseobacterium hagamense]GEN77085.1 hypothetical protein CHA01nite_28250 [Chryseobacterium hagamense]